ncbi:MAG: BREX-1 system phosphatase PglZ type A [Clostridiaceae bacterium]|jgi:uncharacterized protein (TIGR02687 family)|nr:BREX-1 system phosphatase PglZ type A [Clostridiaceae bacterium]
MSKTGDALLNLFDKYRIILWYDNDQSFREEYDSMSLPGIEKMVVDNNEFAIKHKLYVTYPTGRFLLYLPYDKPVHDENWLLDVELSNYVFHTDREAIVLQELELPIALRSWIQPHMDFFRSAERTARFKELCSGEDTEQELSLKMVQVVLGTASASLDSLITRYATLFVEKRSDDVDKELEKFNLSSILWQRVKLVYEYDKTKSGIYDFLLEVFQKNLGPLADKAQVNDNAVILLSKWKDMRSFEGPFRELSQKIERDLKIELIVEQIPLNEALKEDVFECIDRRIIKELAHLIIHQAQSVKDTEEMLKSRETTVWADRYAPFYRALESALWLGEVISRQEALVIQDYQDGFTQYTSSWYMVDQYYRQFIEHYRSTNQNSVLNPLYQWVHKSYSNVWLPRLSQTWQQVIDKQGAWYKGSLSQNRFFKEDVKARYLDKPIKVFVVISDGLRYECGKLLHEKITGETRFTSSIEYRITALPSYTQLGMAAMLPHRELSFGEGDSILADGRSTQGLQSRLKILEQQSGVRATAILAEDLMKLTPRGLEANELVRQHDLVYVYHNRIDKLGDDKTTEDKVIEASREEVSFLMDIAKKIANMNIVHIIFTSDHGFIYQHEELLSSDFTDAGIQGEVLVQNRRYVMGKSLSHNQNVVKFISEDLNIAGEREILIPKGIARLPRQGSGSRYVHGGMTLQEVVVPVLFVSKRREDVVSKVDIDILSKTSNRITTNIHTISFYQMQPVGEKFIARTVKAFFAVMDEKGHVMDVISDLFTYTFDLTSETSREREVINRFKISTTLRKSNDVYLIIEEKVDKAEKWILLNRFPYQLTLAMDNDFDEI